MDAMRRIGLAGVALVLAASTGQSQTYTCDGHLCRGESKTISIIPRELTGSDAEFGGHGPLTEVLAAWRVSEDRKLIRVLLQMSAREATMKGMQPDTAGDSPTILGGRPIEFLVVALEKGCIAEGGPMNLAATDSAVVLLRGEQPLSLDVEDREACAAQHADGRACRVTNHGVVQRWDLYGGTDGEDIGHTRALATIRAPEFEVQDCGTSRTRPVRMRTSDRGEGSGSAES